MTQANLPDSIFGLPVVTMPVEQQPQQPQQPLELVVGNLSTYMLPLTFNVAARVEDSLWTGYIVEYPEISDYGWSQDELTEKLRMRMQALVDSL